MIRASNHGKRYFIHFRIMCVNNTHSYIIKTTKKNKILSSHRRTFDLLATRGILTIIKGHIRRLVGC